MKVSEVCTATEYVSTKKITNTVGSRFAMVRFTMIHFYDPR